MKGMKIGIYCHPDSVAGTPDFAKRLVEEGGVDCFILRSGYDFTYPESQEKAVQIVRDLKAKLCFMVGSFWGGRPPVEGQTFSPSNESKAPMDMPGPVVDGELVAKYQRLCLTFKPDSLCVTHGRYRHPAYIDGMFNEGTNDEEYQARMTAAGIPQGDILTARSAWEKAFGSLDKESLLQVSQKGLIEFLCELSQSDAVKRLVAFRCDTIHQSISKYKKAVNECGVSFGANGYTPFGALICGQDYEKSYAETCDFLQPLLCYMEWHRYMLISAWARYIQQFLKIDESVAIQAAKNIFELGDTIIPDSLNEIDTFAEGSMESVYSIVSKEIQMCKPFVSKPYQLQPVLRGKDWDWTMTDKLVDEAKAIGIDSFVFMGCEYLVKGPVPDVKGSSPMSAWS